MSFYIGYVVYKICTKIPDYSPIGYRKPGTKIGSWTGAYVALAQKGIISAAFFENNIDYICHPKKWCVIETHVLNLVDNGWIKMTAEDLELTAGV